MTLAKRKIDRKAARRNMRIKKPTKAIVGTSPKPYVPPRDPSYAAPEDLHLILAPAQTKVVTFPNEKAMINYRARLYYNNQHTPFRYRTIRDEKSMWGIIIWRMV